MGLPSETLTLVKLNFMKVKLPQGKAILGYHDFFGEELQERLALIQHMCRTNLIAEISGLNYRIKPNNQLYNDYNIKTQDRELLYFSGEQRDIYERYGQQAQKLSRGPGDFPLLFTRQTCLFALEEIINSDITVIPGFSMRDSWENLLKYLFAVNTAITKIKKEADEEELDQASDLSKVEVDEEKPPLSLEDISVKTLVLNELNISSNQLYVPFRAYQLLQFMTAHADIGQIAKDYLIEQYQMDFDRFIFEIMSLYMANNPDGKNNVKSSGLGLPIDTTFIYYPKEDTLKLFETFSQRFPNTEYEKLLSIRKYPFYNSGESFLLTDNTILLEKSYSQFLNDFWFDKVKNIKDGNNQAVFNIKRYRSIVGEFFESYLKSITEHIAAQAKHFKVKSFDELVMDIDGEENELTDIYIRYVDKVFLGEAKSTGIYDKEKYSGDLNEFYKESREKFFDSFGMKQIVRAITLLPAHATKVDPGFPQKGKVRIFPALIVNEKALQTPLMAQIFNKRFQELVKPLDLGKYIVAPLSLLHVSDLENMEEHLNEDPKRLWKILEHHTRHAIFMPPFFNTLNVLGVKPTYNKPLPLYLELINKFGNKEPNAEA